MCLSDAGSGSKAAGQEPHFSTSCLLHQHRQRFALCPPASMQQGECSAFSLDGGPCSAPNVGKCPQSRGACSPVPLHCWLTTSTQPQWPDPSVETACPLSCCSETCKHGVYVLRQCGSRLERLTGPTGLANLAIPILWHALLPWPAEGTACGWHQLFWEPNIVAAAISLGFVTLQVPHTTRRLVSSITKWGYVLWDWHGPSFSWLEATCLPHHRALTRQASPNKQI